MSLNFYRTLKPKSDATLRGDTMIEVMFAIVVFAFIAVLSISAMDASVAEGENALELVTARGELNAQAEALRFVHSSYISEKTLPLRSSLTSAQIANDEKHQQYKELWDTIIANAITPADAEASGLLNLADTVNNSDTDGRSDVVGCARVYERGSEGTLLSRTNAFVLNTRDLSSLTANGRIDVDVSYVSARTQPTKFREAELNARIIFAQAGEEEASTGLNGENSTTTFTDGAVLYNRVAMAEGIWVVAVSDGEESNPANSKYYDFYIESCWYGPNTTSPTVLDTVIRLYNPENV